MQKPHVHSGGRYPVLRALAIIYMIGALLAVAVGVYSIWWAMARFNDGVDRLVLVSGACAATFLVVVTMLAISEVLKLIIDIEHNTRMTAMNSVSERPMTVAPTATRDGGRLAELDAETAEGALIRGH